VPDVELPLPYVPVPPELSLLPPEVPPDMPLLPDDPVAPGWSEAERRSQPASAKLIRPAAKRIFVVFDVEFMVVPFLMVSN
jgi:hypothetical protein